MGRLMLFSASALLALASTAQQLANTDADPSPPAAFAAEQASSGSWLLFGDVVVPAANMPFDTLTGGEDGHLGIHHMDGYLWTTARGTTSPGQKAIFQFKPATPTTPAALVNTWIQGGSAQASAWGHRDMADWEAATGLDVLFAGHEAGAFVFYSWDGTTLTFGGESLVGDGAGGNAGTVRALCEGHPVNSFFWTKSFTGTTYMFGPVGNYMSDDGGALAAISAYGFGSDFSSSGPSGPGTIWSSHTPALGPGGVNSTSYVEFDPSTWTATGNSFVGTALSVAQAGVDIYVDPANPGRLSLLGMHQSTPDTGELYDLDRSLVGGFPGGDPFLTYCTAKLNSLGCLPAIAGSGYPSATAPNGFKAVVSNVRNQKPGLFFYSLAGPTCLPFQCGTLCVATKVRRTPAQSAGGTPNPANDCTGVYSLDFNCFAQGLCGGNPNVGLKIAGNSYCVQAWGRDQGHAAPCNTTLSDGLSVLIGT